MVNRGEFPENISELIIEEDEETVEELKDMWSDTTRGIMNSSDR